MWKLPQLHKYTAFKHFRSKEKHPSILIHFDIFVFRNFQISSTPATSTQRQYTGSTITNKYAAGNARLCAKRHVHERQETVHIHTRWHWFKPNQITSHGPSNRTKCQLRGCHKSAENLTISTGRLANKLWSPLKTHNLIKRYYLTAK